MHRERGEVMVSASHSGTGLCHYVPQAGDVKAV